MHVSHLVTREVTSILNDTQSNVKVTSTHNIERPVNGKGHIKHTFNVNATSVLHI